MSFAEQGQWVDRFFESGRWQLTLVVVVYAAIIWITSRFLIAGPLRQEVVGQIAAERALLRVMKAEAIGDAEKLEFYDEACPAIDELLAEGVNSVSWTFGDRLHTAPFVTLTRVLTARRYLHQAQLLRIRSFTEDHLALAEMSSARLRRAGVVHGVALAKQIDTIIAQHKRARSDADRAQVDTELRIAVTEAIRLWWQDEDIDLDEVENSQRRVLWLVTIGLVLAFVVGLTGHRTTLLFGALGGFLSPLIRIRWRRAQSDDYAASWGVLLLSPVAGALTAYGGVLLVTFLTSPEVKLLGQAFDDAGWENSNGPISLTLALLFGFSARLFSSLALSAAGAVAPSAQPGPAGDGDGAGGGPRDGDGGGGDGGDGGDGGPGAPEPAEAPRPTRREASAPPVRDVGPRHTKAARGLGKSRPAR